MSNRMRKVIGIITTFTPPFFGLWLWYLWWKEPEQWNYLGDLIKHMTRQPFPYEGSSFLGTSYGILAKWDVDLDELILFESGRIGLFDKEDKCKMCSFGGGGPGDKRIRKLTRLMRQAYQKYNSKGGQMGLADRIAEKIAIEIIKEEQEKEDE